MSQYEKRRLDAQPSKAEIEQQQDLIQNKNPPQITGYGIPQPYVAPKAPEKPTDLPTKVTEWLEGTTDPQVPLSNKP